MRVLLLTAIGAAILFSVPAHAQLSGGGGADQQVENPDPCQGTMSIDTCMWSDDPMANGGGNYAVCYAFKANKQTCQSSVTDNITKQASCQGVTYNAYCQCVNLVVSGNCYYQ